ncbi:MAG TPA: hypothetical protein VEW42_00370 [Candidatus Eisenbacteria bacterium]|nr:hypothetical protein [Candidatus Eisenbacteria bacterium]
MKKYFFSLSAILFLLICIAILYTFWDLPKTFFQQDEWLGSGQVLALGYGAITHGLSPLQILFADARPLTRLIGVLFTVKFSFNPAPYAYYGIFLHIVNSLLVYLIIKKLLKNTLAAFVGTVFFALNSVSHQSITWFAASFGLQPASVCIFLSIYLFLLFIENNKVRFAFISLFFALLSLYFKESGIFLFAFLPIMPFIFRKKIETKKYIKIFSPFIIFIILFVLYRIVEIIIPALTPRDLFNSPVYASINQGKLFFVQSMIARFIMYPMTSLSLMFIPQYSALSIAYDFMKVYYPYITDHFDLIGETVVLDMLSTIGSFLLLIYIGIEIKFDKKSRHIVLFIISLFFLSIIPYIIIGKTFAYMEPRYYYIPLAAGGILVGYIAKNIFLINKKFFTLKLAFALVFVYLMFLHVNEIKQDIQTQVVIASERKGFIAQLINELPTLKENVNVFYFTSDRKWWKDTNTVPFQHGFGYSVPVLYYNTGRMPKQLLINGYLWTLGSEGYTKVNDVSYGYYTSFDHLKEAKSTYHFSWDDIHAFYYDSKKMKLQNITEQTRDELSNEDK